MAEKLNIRKSLKDNTMVLILVGVMLLFEVLIQSFGKGSLFSPANITNIIRQNSYVVILATGMLLCILTGGNIDLSVGSVVALVGALAGVLIVKMGMPVAPAIFLCIVCGILIGAFHGFFIAYLHIVVKKLLMRFLRLTLMKSSKRQKIDYILLKLSC